MFETPRKQGNPATQRKQLDIESLNIQNNQMDKKKKKKTRALQKQISGNSNEMTKIESDNINLMKLK